MTDIEYWEKIYLNPEVKTIPLFSKKALTLIKEKNLKSVLDLGCGYGASSIYFAKNNLEVSAVDISQNAIDLIKKRSKYPKLKLIKLDLSKDLPKLKTRYDVIFSHLSLIYFDNKTTIKIFNEIFKLLNPNGLFFIKVKSTDDKRSGQGIEIEKNYFKGSHARKFFSKKDLSNYLHKFKIIKIRKTSGTYHKYKSNFIEVISTKN